MTDSPRIQDILQFPGVINILDVGAAAIAEKPIYVSLLREEIGFLNAFEGDPRHIAKLNNTYGSRVRIFDSFLFDGSDQNFYQATAASGMSSLLKPDDKALKFFNGFENFGKILNVEPVSTEKLDDIEGLEDIDFCKMDIQGAELTVLKNGMRKLGNSVAIQLEVSYICLYEDQPAFGEVDVWMRQNGFSPHCFLDVKRWSISPTIRNNNFRKGFNQLLESDVVYVKDPLNLSQLSVEALKKYALISHYCLHSPDLTIHCINELLARGELPNDTVKKYLHSASKKVVD